MHCNAAVKPLEAAVAERNGAAAGALAEVNEHRLVVTHGDGRRSGCARCNPRRIATFAAIPLHLLGAESEGMIGYLLDDWRMHCPNATSHRCVTRPSSTCSTLRSKPTSRSVPCTRPPSLCPSRVSERRHVYVVDGRTRWRTRRSRRRSRVRSWLPDDQMALPETTTCWSLAPRAASIIVGSDEVPTRRRSHCRQTPATALVAREFVPTSPVVHRRARGGDGPGS